MIDKTKMVKNYARLVNLQSLYEENLAKKPGNETVEQLLAQIKEVKECFNELNLWAEYYHEAAKERDKTIFLLDSEVSGLKEANRVLTESRQEAWDRIAQFEKDYSGKI